VGDVMMDAVRQNLSRARRARHGPGAPEPRSYYLATLHRQENVDDPRRLVAILGALSALPHPTILPVHPRTRKAIRALRLRTAAGLHVRAPATYLEMLVLLGGARAVLTDSGGVQKEAFILGTPCITLRESTEWVETLESGANRLAGANPARIRRAVRDVERSRPRWSPTRLYGRGRAAEAVAKAVSRFLERSARLKRAGA
jgi:UDP-N-acetylglucosamine 2-epimerase